MGQRRSRAEVGGYPLVCFERHVKADRQSRTRKQLCVVKMNWMIESACHAGMLGDNRTPVGSVEYLYSSLVLIEHLFLQLDPSTLHTFICHSKF